MDQWTSITDKGQVAKGHMEQGDQPIKQFLIVLQCYLEMGRVVREEVTVLNMLRCYLEM